MTVLSQEFLKSILHYDPGTGCWTCLASKWKKRIGSPSGRINWKGYVQLLISRKYYSAHRLAFLYMHGSIPIGEIDHINLNKADNRFCNLREATKTLNQANKSLSSKNTSGFKGVTRHRKTGKWQAQISINRKYKYLGLFNTEQEAHAAYACEAKELFGEFARVA